MQLASYRDIRGFTIFELIVAMGLATVILGGALALTSQAIGISQMVSQRSDMQQNGRVAINMMALDASLAGTGFPVSGIQLPAGTGSQDSFFACDEVECHITNNVYTAERLYATWPGQAGGPTINGVATDVFTVVYEDPNSEFDQFVFTDMNANGKQVTFDPATTPAWNDAVVGLKPGDVILLNNTIGVAAATVTKLHDDHIHLDPGSNDPLNFNQQGAAGFGTPVSIYGPPTTARRILIITYYIDDSNPDVPLLMRQVNAQPDSKDQHYDYSPLAENDLDREGFERITLATSVGPRNLTYKDRYE